MTEPGSDAEAWRWLMRTVAVVQHELGVVVPWEKYLPPDHEASGLDLFDAGRAVGAALRDLGVPNRLDRLEFDRDMLERELVRSATA